MKALHIFSEEKKAELFLISRWLNYYTYQKDVFLYRREKRPFELAFASNLLD
jgi:hypothetical protein